jgi:hypothetical protein
MIHRTHEFERPGIAFETWEATIPCGHAPGAFASASEAQGESAALQRLTPCPLALDTFPVRIVGDHKPA